MTLTYDSYGNIRSKSDVGNYTYHADRPHAVKTAGGATYAYDANGNNTSGDGRTLTYTVFDKLETVTKNGHRTSFAYGPDRSRYKRTDTKSGQTTTVLYIGSVEKMTHPDGRREVKRYLGGVVIETESQSASGAVTGTDLHYMLKDHLGSLDVITDAEGVVVQELSHDSWGQRRNASNWQPLSETELTGFDSSRTRRGFTGHEHLDETGIIHMNGRIYDPKLGRFLQADPFVQSPAMTQSHNRYSYVLNNPLNATDPSGFFIKKFFNKVFGAINKALGDEGSMILAIVVNIWMPGLGGLWAKIAAGFLAGGITSGSFEGAVIGAVTAAVSYGGDNALEACGDACSGSFAGSSLKPGTLVGKVAAKSVVAGITSDLQGGKFGHGFASAGLTHGFSDAIGSIGGEKIFSLPRILAAATVGGTASELTGGKFANGALTGAFSRAFNDEVEYGRRQKALDFFEKIKEALDILGSPYNTPEAAWQLLGTGIAESKLSERVQVLENGKRGVARGLLQVELDTAKSLINSHIKFRPQLVKAFNRAWQDPPSTYTGTPLEYNLEQNDTYSIMMARIKYRSSAAKDLAPLPAVGDIRGNAIHWRNYYNTTGDGTVEHFMKEWRYFMGGSE